MAQLHLYLPDKVAERVREQARSRGLSVSAYLGEVVRSQITDEWPKDFFSKVVGGWEGKPLQRAEQLPFDEREDMDVPSRRKRLHRDTE
jgi:hypothetical protein